MKGRNPDGDVACKATKRRLVQREKQITAHDERGGRTCWEDLLPAGPVGTTFGPVGIELREVVFRNKA